MKDSQKITLHQIYYEPQQQAELDQGFLAYDNCHSELGKKWCEYDVIRKVSQAGIAEESLVGCLSWKFRQKTGLTAADFLQWIRHNPGFDVYVINPFRDLYTSNYQNVWHQGDTRHPGMKSFAQEILNRLDYKLNLDELVNLPEEMAYCNFWAGNREFWSRYIAFCEPIFQYCETSLSGEEKGILNETRLPSGLTILPYVMERMFSTFLAVDRSAHRGANGGGLRVLSYPRPSTADSVLAKIQAHIDLAKYRAASGDRRDDFDLINALLWRIEEISMSRDQLLTEHNRLGARLSRSLIRSAQKQPLIKPVLLFARAAFRAFGACKARLSSLPNRDL